jgi:hypothetical protein
MGRRGCDPCWNGAILLLARCLENSCFFCRQMVNMVGNLLYLTIKSEYRISKSETNSNDKKRKFETIRLGRPDFGICEEGEGVRKETAEIHIKH